MGDERLSSVVQTRITQVALVVRDLQATMEAYHRTFGWGPWTLYEIDGDVHRQRTARGAPVDHTFKMALTTVGDIDFELIEPLEGPSPYKEFLEQKGEGLHHIMVRRLDGRDAVVRAQLDSRGLPALLSGVIGDLSYAYYDDPELKTIVETFDVRGPDVPSPTSTYPPVTDPPRARGSR